MLWTVAKNLDTPALKHMLLTMMWNIFSFFASLSKLGQNKFRDICLNFSAVVFSVRIER